MEEIKWQPVSERYTERQIPSNAAVYHPPDNSGLSQFMMFPLDSDLSSINFSFPPVNPSLFVSCISKVRSRGGVDKKKRKEKSVLVHKSARRQM